MSNENLVLHLKLDTIIPDGGNQRVRSALSENVLALSENVLVLSENALALSENALALTESQYGVNGSPQVVTDEHFGSCFIFDGNNDYVELSPTTIPTGNEITVCFWANGGENLPNENHIVLAQTAQNSRVLNIHLPWSDEVICFDCGGDPNDQDLNYDRISKSIGTGQDAVQYKGKWNHWAFTKDATKGEMKIYLNGVLWHHEEGKTQPILPAAKAYIAKNYPGKMANLRIYKKALSPEEIKQDMNDDLTAIAAFNLAYPLDFDLYEGDNKESIIFIENDTKGEELVFEIKNDTEQGITLPAKTGAVSQNNYHFELRFRPDTLSPKSLQQLALASQNGWSMSSPVTQPDGIVSLYFLTTNTTLAANQNLTLTLQNVSASAEGGARTTRVEFLCPEFTYQGETLTNYYREKPLSVIDHRGKKNIPLHVSFVGSNRILNDEQTPNELILRIVNVLKDKAIPLIPDSKGDNASKFIIYFDVQEANQNKNWALGTTSQVKGIEIEIQGQHIEGWKIVKETQGESQTWTITNQNEKNVELGQEQGIELKISKIISSLPSGQTNLYIRYENIPGYWDGTFICTIDKAPILYKDGKVGIGTSTPTAKLDVNGSLHLGGEMKLQNLPRSIPQLYVSQNQSRQISINHWADVSGEDQHGYGLFASNAYVIGSFSAPSVNSAFKYANKHSRIGAIGFAVNYPSYNQASVITSGTTSSDSQTETFEPKVIATFTYQERVGIGTNEPQAKLEVSGDLKATVTPLENSITPWIAGNFGSATGDRVVLGNLHGKATIGAHNNGLSGWSNLILQTDGGNVGIGTNNPQAKLDVNGSLKVTGFQYFPATSGSPHVGAFRFGDGSGWSLHFGRQLQDNSDPGGVSGAALTIVDNGNVFVHGGLYFKSADSGQGWVRLYRVGGASTVTGDANQVGPSDLRFKTVLRPIANALDKVLQLNGNYFQWNEEGIKHFTRHIADQYCAGLNATEEENQTLWEQQRQEASQSLAGEKIGLIAQNVETVVPEIVSEDQEGYKYVDYQHLTALLVEAIKDQQKLIQQLETRITALESLS